MQDQIIGRSNKTTLSPMKSGFIVDRIQSVGGDLS